MLIEALKNRVDLEFGSYIKMTTGYNFDLFKVERSKVQSVLANGIIDTEEDSWAVNLMLRVYQTASDDFQTEEVLKKLLSDFYDREKESNKIFKGKNLHSKVVKKLEKDGIVTETIEFLSHGKLGHFNIREAVSPDGKRKVTITERSDAKYPSTSVTISFDGACGPVYGTNDIYPDVNAFWKDNDTIVMGNKETLC